MSKLVVTCLYAIEEVETGMLLNIKGRIFYSVREDARTARRFSPVNKKVRIVKASFTNYTDWSTAK